MKTDEVMCVFVLGEEKFEKENELVSLLLNKFKNIKTIVKNINTRNTNVILGNKNIVLYGNGYIQDKLGKYTFNISTNSFYQVNPPQTEKLYDFAISSANLNKNDIVFDLYCGIGTIAIFTSDFVKRVYGIEIVPNAIKDANENAKINGINNIEFMVGDVETALSELIKKENVLPDVVFVDPPRKGLDNRTIANLLKMKPKKIVYISCNPSSLMRDLHELEQCYIVQMITPVDLFPWTSHVEVVSVLGRKDEKKPKNQ